MTGQVDLRMMVNRMWGRGHLGFGWREEEGGAQPGLPPLCQGCGYHCRKD